MKEEEFYYFETKNGTRIGPYKIVKAKVCPRCKRELEK